MERNKLMWLIVMVAITVLALVASIMGEELSNSSVISTMCVCTLAIITTRGDDD